MIGTDGEGGFSMDSGDEGTLYGTKLRGGRAEDIRDIERDAWYSSLGHIIENRHQAETERL